MQKYKYAYLQGQDYTLQSNNSNFKTMLLLKHPASVMALVSTYINTLVHGDLSSGNLVLTKLLSTGQGWEVGGGQVGGRIREASVFL